MGIEDELSSLLAAALGLSSEAGSALRCEPFLDDVDGSDEGCFDLLWAEAISKGSKLLLLL